MSPTRSWIVQIIHRQLRHDCADNGINSSSEWHTLHLLWSKASTPTERSEEYINIINFVFDESLNGDATLVANTIETPTTGLCTLGNA